MRRPLYTQFLIKPAYAASSGTEDPFAKYRFRILDYVRECLNARVWPGVKDCLCRGGTVPHDHPGLEELLLEFDRMMQAQHEASLRKQIVASTDATVTLKLQAELNELPFHAYTPGALLKQELQVPGGHGIGKTFAVAMAANYFFDVFTPCVISIVAPKAEQAKKQVLQAIKDVRRRGLPTLPGRIMDAEIRGARMLTASGKDASDHRIRVATASREGGKAGTKLQGMHAPYQLVIMDEAEGIHESFLAPIQSWLSGGQGIICELANPETRTSWFHKRRDAPRVTRLTVSAVYHPNVLHDTNEFPGAVDRNYVEDILSLCKRVPEHNQATGTVTVPWRPGEIFEPDEAFSFRVLGEAPATFSPRCFVTPAAFDMARMRGDALVKATGGVLWGSSVPASIGVLQQGPGEDTEGWVASP